MLINGGMSTQYVKMAPSLIENLYYKTVQIAHNTHCKPNIHRWTKQSQKAF